MRRAVRWLFESRSTGQLVVVQRPNAPLWVWIASAILRRVVASVWVAVVGTVALLVWAGLEVAAGVNPFRRIVGGIVLVVVVAGVVR
jgi:hypothetical protein